MCPIERTNTHQDGRLSESVKGIVVEYGANKLFASRKFCSTKNDDNLQVYTSEISLHE